MSENVGLISLAQGRGAVMKMAEDELVVQVGDDERSFTIRLLRLGLTTDGRRAVVAAWINEELKSLAGW